MLSWSILQYFWPALSDYWSWKPIFWSSFEWPLKTCVTVHFYLLNQYFYELVVESLYEVLEFTQSCLYESVKRVGRSKPQMLLINHCKLLLSFLHLLLLIQFVTPKWAINNTSYFCNGNVWTARWQHFTSWRFKECHTKFEPRHEISNNVVCATSKGSDQPAHTRSVIRAFVSRLNILWLLSYWLNIILSF